MFEESTESRDVFGTQASIYEGVFFVKILTALLSSQ